MAGREQAVRTWLAVLAARPRFQRRRWRLMNLRDAYERGYQHGRDDERNQQERKYGA